MLLVAGSLSVLDQGCLLFLAHFIKLLLGFFELAQVTAKTKQRGRTSQDYSIFLSILALVIKNSQVVICLLATVLSEKVNSEKHL